jgi:hypothetical protein
MLEWFTASLAYSLVKDVGGAIKRKLKPISPTDILAAREKWRPLFEKEIWTNFKGDLRQDVIVVNIAKLDQYPNTDEKRKGISPWFRAALLDTCDMGALIGLSIGTLTKIDDAPGWRYTNHDAGETGDIKAELIGIIPFELIENVNWQGTDYYNFPHIYCHFHEKQGQPYRKIAFYQERPRPEMPPYYLEIGPREPIRKVSKRLGIKYFG